MDISDIISNILIGIISGGISSIIVTRAFMLIQSYLDEFTQIRIVALKIYRADIYLRVITSQASKYVSYEKNPNIMIRKIANFNKEIKFINKILEEIREECLFSQYNCKTLEKYRDEIKGKFEQNIDDVATYNVNELENLLARTSELYDEYQKINKGKMNDILKLILKDITIWIILVGIVIASLILVALNYR